MVHKDDEELERIFYQNRLRAGAVLPKEENARRGVSSVCVNTWKEVQRQQSQALFRGA